MRNASSGSSSLSGCRFQGRRASAACDFSLYWIYPTSRYRVCVLMVMISASHVVSRTQKVPSSILGRLIFSPGNTFFCVCRSSPTLAEQLVVCSHKITKPLCQQFYFVSAERCRRTPESVFSPVCARKPLDLMFPSSQNVVTYNTQPSHAYRRKPPSCYRTVIS